MSQTRARIRRRIEREPGIHFRALTRGLELATGQVQYHLGRLEDVRVERVNGRTHYFPPGYTDWEQTALALLRRETARDIVAALYDDGEARPAAVADRVGIARSTLEHHLDGLVAGDIVAKHHEGNRVRLSLVRPEETVTLLGTVAPSLAERLTDRFERLVDSLLEPTERA